MAIQKARERAIVAKLMLDTMREFGAAYLKRKRFGSSADELLLLAAVLVGQAEGRPMATAKVAEYAGVARPSAIRKLDRMVKRGIVEKVDGRYLIPEHVANSARVLRAADAARKRIRRAAAG
jgi:DNA-binding IclR family transcriptional regulator